MAAKGYIEAGDVAGFLNRSFTVEEEDQCDVLIENAEIYIDNETGRAWLTGAQTDEIHYVDSQNVFVKYAPIATVDAISGRAGLGESETTLTVDVDFEVIDLDAGQIRLIYPASYDRILVDYTPVATVPADLKQACIELVANWLQPYLQPGSFGLDSYSLPDLTVKFSRSHVQSAMPPLAMQIIERYRYPVHG